MLILVTLLVLLQKTNSSFQDIAMKVSVQLMSRIPNETYNNFVIIRDDSDIDDQKVFDEVDLISDIIYPPIQILHFK